MKKQNTNVQIEKALLYQCVFQVRKKINFQDDFTWIEKGNVLTLEDQSFSAQLRDLISQLTQLERLRFSYINAYQKGVRWIFPKDPDFPVSLRNLENPVLCLSYLGKPLWKEHDFFFSGRKPGT